VTVEGKRKGRGSEGRPAAKGNSPEKARPSRNARRGDVAAGGAGRINNQRIGAGRKTWERSEAGKGKKRRLKRRKVKGFFKRKKGHRCNRG